MSIIVPPEPSAQDDAGALFALPSDAIKITSDDCYTPRWVFDAMGLEFDLDVAAPPGGPWHVPAKRYYTAEDDGLASPWDGLVWCNPPFTRPDGDQIELRQHVFVAFRGVGDLPAKRLAHGDPRSAVLYGKGVA